MRLPPHSPGAHCRKAHSVAFARLAWTLWSCSVHTSRPVSTTLMSKVLRICVTQGSRLGPEDPLVPGL